MAAFRILLVGLFLINLPISGYGQETTATPNLCAQKVNQAETEFSAGHFYSIPSLLSCVDESNLSREQLVRAYLILCQAYLILDDPTAAGDTYLKLLKADPEFAPNQDDHPIDIVYLSKQYTATPIFTPHFRFGVSTSFYRSIYSVTTTPYGAINERPLQFGLHAGGGVDWNINDNISLCLEADISSRGYQRIQTSSVNFDEATVSASQWWIDLPIYAKYGFSLNDRIRPFGYVGLSLNYLLSANNEFSHVDNKPSGTQLLAEGPSENVTSQRNQFNRSWLAGVGARYKVGKNFFYIDVRYMGGLSNIADESKIYYADQSSIDPSQIGSPTNYLSANVTTYHFVSDLFRLDNLSLTFGYVKPLYNPRKVKKARTKGVARQIRKEGGKEK